MAAGDDAGGGGSPGADESRGEFARLLELFSQARALPPGERPAFVARACGDDDALRAELEAMLAQPDDAQFLAQPPSPTEGPSADPLLGQTLGDFELLERLGAGGMGVVYKARQLSLDRLVALKVLVRSPLLGQAVATRFQREFKAIAKLRHAGIVTVHESGEQAGTHYYAMDLVEGNDLAAELQRLRGEATRLGVDTTRLSIRGADSYVRAVVRIVRDAADALQYAHDRDIVHRDIKPSNLLLDEEGSVHMVDFGLARDLTLETVTGAGELAGSTAYMSPEQAASELHEAVNQPSDIYSLGVVLYELLTLQRPHSGRTERELLEAIQKDRPRPLRAHNPRLPRDLEAIVGTAMAKLPAERYASAGALRDDLDRVLRHEAVLARHPSWAVLLKRWVRRRWRPLSAVSVASLAAWGAFAYGQSAERRDEAELLSATLSAQDPEQDVSLLELARQVELAALCRRAQQASTWLEDDVLERARVLDRSLRDHAERRRDELLLRLASIAGGGGDAASELAEHLALVKAADRLRALLPDDPDLERLADPERMLPRLLLTAADAAGRAVAARVWARRLDVFSTQPGERIDLGQTPVDVVLPAGLYRLVVRFPDGVEVELSRDLLEVGGRVQVAATQLPWPDDRSADMVLFDAATYSIPVEEGAMSHLAGETLSVEPFWLDRHEVSNADYLEFLEAHPGAEQPKFWGAQRPDGWERLPVTGLSWLEIRDYAEWRGKRLPTFAEWNWAARGAEMRPFAWTASLTEPPACVPVGHDMRGQTLEEIWEVYLREARPVDGCPESATPEGLQYLYGNVNEFTESVWVQRDANGDWRPLVDQRILAGKSWTVWYPGEDLRFQGYTRTDRHSAMPDIGFRLALSAGP